MVYTPERPPVWDETSAAYVDPKTREPLPTSDQALADLDDRTTPTRRYVARLGTIDPREIKGVEAGTRDAERCIRYVTKYVTKGLGDTVTPTR